MTRVLIVDDNPQDRFLVRRALLNEFDGIEVLEAADQAALDELISGGPFDAVVTDFRLRWSDGLEVLDAIHRRHPDTPVVMFTNTGSEEVAASGLRHGLSDYIVKMPGRYARVAHAVRHGIQGAHVRRLEVELLAREQEARRAAEEANRIKDEFLAMVSHELRTPLHAITGWLHVLQTQQKDPSPLASRALEALHRNSRMLARVVEDLMDSAGILSGKLRLASEATQVEDAVRGAVEGTSTAAAAKRLTVTLGCEHGLRPVWGDPERLQQVFRNLLNNAVKFTPDGGRIDVEVTGDGTHVVTTVADSGQGIAPDFLPRVFDRFSQEDSGNTRAFSGLGLGLALVRQLVDAHGGTITADSAGAGQGAAFTVRLPAAPAGGSAANS